MDGEGLTLSRKTAPGSVDEKKQIQQPGKSQECRWGAKIQARGIMPYQCSDELVNTDV